MFFWYDVCKEENRSRETDMPYTIARDRIKSLYEKLATSHLFYSHPNLLVTDDRGSHRLDTLVGGDVALSIQHAAIPDLTFLKTC